MKKRDLTEGSIAKNLFFLAGPIVLGMFLQSAYNIIDTIFIGMLGANELAAVSITFPVVFIFIALASGLSTGTTIIVSQSIGAKKLNKASNAAEHALFISFFIGIIIAILGILFSEPVFLFMGATPEVLPLTIQYSQLIFIGFIFMFTGFIAQGILQAEGDSSTPLKINIVSVLLNVVLDAVLIFGLFGFPALGITGAALATVISRIIATGLVLLFLIKGKAQTKISLNPKLFKMDFKLIKKLFVLGTPASLGNVLNSIGMILLMSLIGVYGAFAIAAYGIGIRIDSVARMPIIGLMSGIIAITGQNIGAKKINRIQKTIKVASIISIISTILFTLIMIFFPETLFKIFSSDLNVISIGTQYLSIVAFTYVFYGIAFNLMGVFLGAGKTIISTAMIGLNWTIVLIFAFLLSPSMGLTGIWIALLAGSILFCLSLITIYFLGLWKPKENLY
ncbi:MAG: MATE family efflux transporter [Candidatus Diapherotrites archaeon]|nr:MATE family efflux transporter [Candidatus Diapherotrites archaeon]